MAHKPTLPGFDDFEGKPRPSGQCHDTACDLTQPGCTARRSHDLGLWTCADAECPGYAPHPRVQPSTGRQVLPKSEFAKHRIEGRQSWCDNSRRRSSDTHSGGTRDTEALARRMARAAHEHDGAVCWTYLLMIVTGRAFPNLAYAGWTYKPPELRKAEHLSDPVNQKMGDAIGSAASYADTAVQIVGTWRHQTAEAGAAHELALYNDLAANLPDGWEIGNAGPPLGTAPPDHPVVKAIRSLGLKQKET